MNRKKGGKRFKSTTVNDGRNKLFELILFLASFLFIFTKVIFKTTFSNLRTPLFLSFFLWRHRTLELCLHFSFILFNCFPREHMFMMIYELRRSKVNQFIIHKNIFYVCTHPLNQDWVCKQHSRSLIDDKGEGFHCEFISLNRSGASKKTYLSCPSFGNACDPNLIAFVLMS